MAPRASYILVVITATGCGHCDVFKQSWPQTKRALQAQFPSLEIVEVHQPRITTAYPASCPSNLNRWGVWFPCVLLVPKSEWTGGAIQSASVFNGSYDANQGKVVQTGRQPMNLATLGAFVQSRLA